MSSIDQRIRELNELREQLAELSVEADLLPPAVVGASCRLIDRVREKLPARNE